MHSYEPLKIVSPFCIVNGEGAHILEFLSFWISYKRMVLVKDVILQYYFYWNIKRKFQVPLNHFQIFTFGLRGLKVLSKGILLYLWRRIEILGILFKDQFSTTYISFFNVVTLLKVRFSSLPSQFHLKIALLEGNL
jgi:hypothetical protein